MDVLERQTQIVVGAQLLLQQFGEPRRLLVSQSRNGERVIASFLGFAHILVPGATDDPARKHRLVKAMNLLHRQSAPRRGS